MSLRRLTARLPRYLKGWFLQIHGAIALGDSEPEPDGVILRGDETACDGRLPTAADVGLIIEISDSSLAFDRRDKGRIYPRGGVPVYWIIKVADKMVEVCSDPESTGDPPVYRSRRDHRPGEDVPVVLDGRVVAKVPVSELLP